MKKPTLFQRALGILLLPLLFVCLTLPAQPVLAQDNDYPVPPETYSREELAQMLAPIALYPDALLSQILMASTYPLEVIEADRWMRRNPDLKGDALDSALLQEEWDPSVKAICHFPSILGLMSEKIGQTTDLGNAFLAQEGEVMDVIQELRSKAYAQGNLASNSREKVVVQDQTIVIEPANPQVIYVPYYDPLYIYGPWWYPGYPPYYWGPPGVYLGVGLFYWPAFYFSFNYGSWCYFDWTRHYVYINVHVRPRYVRHDRWFNRPGRWHHVPRHRRGVAYRDRATARRFGQAPSRSTEFRRDIRGFPERGLTVRERDFRTGERSRTDHTDRTRTRERSPMTARQPQSPQRVERNRQQQPAHQEPRHQAIERERRQQRVEQGRQQQQRVEQELRQRRVERERQQRERATWGGQQQRTEQQRRQQENVIHLRQLQRRTEQQQRAQQRVQTEQQQRVRENVFNRIDNGRMERRSSERGRTSRQGGQEFRSWGGSGGGQPGGSVERRGHRR